MATTSPFLNPRRARPAAIRRAPPATCPCVSVRPLGPSTRTGRSARSRACRRMKLEYGTSGIGTSGCGLRKITVALILSDMTLVHAAVLVKPKTLEAREFARPTIGPDDGLLRIEACGICGSDYEQYEGAQPPHEDYTPFPVIPGHEPLGVIEEIGANARQRWGVREGDRVAVRSGYGCGRCEACSRWEPRLCRKRGGPHRHTHRHQPPPPPLPSRSASSRRSAPTRASDGACARVTASPSGRATAAAAARRVRVGSRGSAASGAAPTATPTSTSRRSSGAAC